MNKPAFSAALLMLAGCAVGPDYQAPADPAQQGYDLADVPAQEKAGVAGPTLIAGPVPADWWKLLGNPALDRTEEQALAGNATLSAAKASLRQAEQVVIEAKAAWYPQADLSAGVQRNGSGGFTAAGGGTSSDFFSIGPSFSYMADLFGATARAVEQSQSQADSQRWQVEAARLTLVGGVATEALAIASARLQIATAEEILASDRKNLAMVQKQFEVGKAARADVLTAQSQLVGDQTQIASLRQQLSVARHALAVLMSRTPADWTPPDFEIVDGEVGRRPIGRCPAHQHRQGMAGDAQLLAQGGDLGLVADQLALRGQHVGAGRLADLELLLHHRQVLAVAGQDLLGGGDLQAGRRYCKRFGRNAADQGEASRLDLPALGIGLGLALLDGARGGAEQVGHIAEARSDREEIRTGAAAGRGEAARAVTLHAGGQIGLRIPGGLGLDHHLLGLAQTGLGGGQSGVAGQGLLLGAVEGGIAEQFPPIGRHRSGDQRGARDAGLFLGGNVGEVIALLRRIGGSLIVGPDSAAGKHQQSGRESELIHSAARRWD